jgi:uncharacterized protein YdaU (DUF1376 family)
VRMKTDIWMPLYIGDFLADTTGLDAERTGCYLLWLMRYWREGCLPDDMPELIESGKLRSVDAPSIAQALLKRFFTKSDDGTWHQKRADLEIALWNGKKLKAKEKASKAAAKRWSGNDAPSIAPSNQQAMLEQCPSPSPLPLPKEQKQEQLLSPPPEASEISKEQQKLIKSEARKLAQQMRAAERAREKEKARQSKPPTVSDEAKLRHKLFKAAIFKYWKSKNDIDCPWDQQEGAQLEMWLKACPTIEIAKFTQFLRHRYQSDVNHAERPSRWIKYVTNFANGPIKKGQRGLSNGQDNKSAARERLDGNRLAIAEALASRGVRGPWDSNGTAGEEIPQPGFGFDDGRVSMGLRETVPEILPPEGHGGN